jgi:hypothetical protein
MSKNLKNLSAQDVVNRIKQGDLPLVSSSYSCASTFDDGTEVPHQVMQSAANELKMGDRPERGQRWVCTLSACSE